MSVGRLRAHPFVAQQDHHIQKAITERLAAVQQGPLRTEPGAQWHYSSLGFVLAGLIVERASGQPYPAFLAERIRWVDIPTIIAEVLDDYPPSTPDTVC